MFLSIVIPAYNEMSRLCATLQEAVAWCDRNVESYEILVVDDGSTDATLEVAIAFAATEENVRVLDCPHQGKGGAVRAGILEAAGERVLFMDADAATPLDEIPKLVDRIDRGYGVAIGSRMARSQEKRVVRSSSLRKLVGRVFSAFVRRFAVGGIYDTQCGFKMFSRDAAREIFSRQRLDGFAFDVEVLFLARKMSLLVAEVPVNWFAQEGSKVHVLRDGIRMVRDVLRIRRLHCRLDRPGS